jgi:hypothetical protein
MRRRHVAKTIEQIRADNEERRQVKAAMLTRPYTVDMAEGEGSDGEPDFWPFELVSSHQEPSAAYPGQIARRCVANFTETMTPPETADGIAFCCNDQSEDDIDHLLEIADERGVLLNECLSLLSEHFGDTFEEDFPMIAKLERALGLRDEEATNG